MTALAEEKSWEREHHGHMGARAIAERMRATATACARSGHRDTAMALLRLSVKYTRIHQRERRPGRAEQRGLEALTERIHEAVRLAKGTISPDVELATRGDAWVLEAAAPMLGTHLPEPWPAVVVELLRDASAAMLEAFMYLLDSETLAADLHEAKKSERSSGGDLGEDSSARGAAAPPHGEARRASAVEAAKIREIRETRMKSLAHEGHRKNSHLSSAQSMSLLTRERLLWAAGAQVIYYDAETHQWLRAHVERAECEGFAPPHLFVLKQGRRLVECAEPHRVVAEIGGGAAGLLRAAAEAGHLALVDALLKHGVSPFVGALIDICLVLLLVTFVGWTALTVRASIYAERRLRALKEIGEQTD